MRRQLIGLSVAGLLGGGGLVWTGVSVLPKPPPPAQTAPAVQPEAVRLAKQASFGPSPNLLAQISSQGYQGWVDAQLNMQGSTYADLATRNVARNFCNGLTGQDSTNCTRENFTSIPVAMRFYANAINGEDQLRLRTAFALGQLIVASENEVKSTAGIAAFNQILMANAFGNYRDILRQVTFNPVMGDYLDMADSRATSPNENYPRELLQLFSLGVNRLNPDGTPQLDATGAEVPAYTPEDIRGVARALTGWTYARLNSAAITDNNQIDYVNPMIPVPARYDTGAKTFLGRTVPAGASQQASVNAVVDAVFEHPNTGPYVSKHLIQQLVTSNPSPAYVRRVAAVFDDNGQGVRGDLKAVVRAILLDDAARNLAGDSGRQGKVKEPILLMTSIIRLIGAASDGYAFTTRDTGLGQQPFRSPSVFNYYPPDYPLPLAPGMVSPQSKLMSTAQVMARHNLAYDWTISGDPNRGEYAPQTVIAGSTGTQVDWSYWQAAGANTDELIDKVNLLALDGTMTAAQRAALKDAVNAVNNSDANVRARRRAQTALYIVTSSPQFQVDR